MSYRKIVNIILLSLTGLIPVASFAGVNTQTYVVNLSNKYSFNAVLTNQCPVPSTYNFYSPIPPSSIDPQGGKGTFTLSVTSSSTSAAQAVSCGNSAFGWHYYLVTYALYDAQGNPDPYHRACEFEYFMQGSSCLAYGKTISDPGATVYCNASATFSDPNTCTINFTIDTKSG